MHLCWLLFQPATSVIFLCVCLRYSYTERPGYIRLLCANCYPIVSTRIRTGVLILTPPLTSKPKPRAFIEELQSLLAQYMVMPSQLVQVAPGQVWVWARVRCGSGPGPGVGLGPGQVWVWAEVSRVLFVLVRTWLHGECTSFGCPCVHFCLIAYVR